MDLPRDSWARKRETINSNGNETLVSVFPFRLSDRQHLYFADHSDDTSLNGLFRAEVSRKTLRAFSFVETRAKSEHKNSRIYEG